MVAAWLVAATELVGAPDKTTVGLLLSAIAALSAAVVFLYRENKQLHQQWRDDIQATKKEMIELNKQTTDAVNTMHELFEKISDARGRR